MPLPITNFKNFLRDAGLQRQSGLGGFGLRRGYPVNFRCLGSDMLGDSLLSVRLATVPTTVPNHFGHPLDDLVARGSAQVSFNGDLGHILLRSTKERFSRGEVLPSLDTFLQTLQQAGLGPQTVCGSCGATADLTVLSDGMQPGLLCARCFESQAARYQQDYGFSASALPSLVLVTATVAVGIALGWAAVAIGVDRLFEWLGGSVNTSAKLMILIALLFGVLMALPAHLFKLVRNRGTVWPVCLALGAALAGVVLGEVMRAEWVIWHNSHQFVLFPGWPFLRRLAFEGNDFFVFLRGFMAATAAFAACLFAKSPKKTLAI